MRMGGRPRQFGIDAERVPEALTAIAEAGLAFEGFHIYWLAEFEVGRDRRGAEEILRTGRGVGARRTVNRCVR